MSEKTGKRITLVGHCGPDMFMLKSAVQRAVPGSVVDSANDDASLSEASGASDLLLINRVLDGSFSTGSGIELIKQLDGSKAARMLVSNLAEPQQEAEAAGAAPGFGKSEIGDEETAQRLRAAVGV